MESASRNLGIACLLAALASLPLEAGCGGARQDPHEDPRMSELRSLEQSIEEERTELANPDLACDDQCRGQGAICDAAARICEITAELGAEHQSRCERARQVCDAARGSVTEGCACDASTDTGGAESLLGDDSAEAL